MFKSKTNIILTVILILLLAGGGVFCFKVLNPPVTAIDYQALTVEEATAWFKENKIEDLCEIKQEYDNEIPEGELIFQSIKEGAKITSKVTLVYSLGADPNSKIEIPDLKTIDECKKWFEENAFENVEYLYSGGDKEDGQVLSIDPKQASKKDKVTVALSGSQKYQVPEFKNKEEAEEWVKDKNIQIVYNQEYSNLAEGAIIKQSPSVVKNGEKLTIVLASKSDAVNLSTNLLGITEDDFLAKCKALGLTNVVKDDEGYYSTVEKGKLAYYLPDGNVSKNTKIVYKLSLGKYEFKASEYNGKTKSEAENYIASLNKKNAQINTELDLVEKSNSDYKVGTLFGCENIGKNNKVQVSCYISKTVSDAKVNLPTNLLGISENEFIEKTKSLGLTNVVKDDKGYYSSLNKKGTIAYYDPDGDISTGTKVIYRLSLGPYSFSENDYNGKTKSDLEKYVKTLNEINAKVKLSTSEKSSDKPSGTAFDCSSSKDGLTTKVSCYISGGTTNSSSSSKATLPTNLLGKTESDFLAKCKELGFTNVVKDESGYYSTVNAKNTIAYYDPDGELDKATKITYKLSLGAYEFSSSNFNGKTKEEATSYVSGLNNINAHITLNVSEAQTSSYEEGKLFDCSASKQGVETVVSCKKAIKQQEEKKATVLNADKLISYYSTSSFDETSSKIKKYFNDAGFTNVSLTGKESTKSVGQILSISINGNASYSQGEYPVSSQVAIEISNKLLN